MKLTYIFRLLFVLALPLSFATQGSASTLQGKVVEILDGEHITVMSVNEPVKVKLIAVAAPIRNQPFADVATKHLSDLVSAQYVVVRYTSFNHDGLVVGRVMLKDMDVGQQMIRDGVAWYDKSEASSLNEQDTQLYAGCEQAARAESRGLWHDPAPLAPWDFRLQESANRSLIARPQALVPKYGKAGKQPLSNDDLFKSMTGTGLPGRFDGPDAGWKPFAQPGRFSIYVPGNAIEFAATIPTPSGKVMEANYAVGTRGRKAYLVVWAKGPTDGIADDQLSDDIANGIAFGLNRSTSQSGSGVQFGVKRQRSVRLGPYGGWQYSVSAPGTPGTIRVFSRRTGQVREFFVMAAVNGTEDDRQVQEFLGSFTIAKY